MLQGNIAPYSPCLCGSIPGRSATDIAMQLQISLEKHILQGQCIYGASLDLHKAFNTLNRDLLKNLCRKLGLGPIWFPYENALRKMERFFNVRGEWSKPLKSTTGVPEGCPLSVVMMALVTWAFTGGLAAKFPGRFYILMWMIGL